MKRELKTIPPAKAADQCADGFDAGRLLAALSALDDLEEEVRAYYLEELERLASDIEQEARTASLDEAAHERRWSEALKGAASEQLIRKLAGSD